MVDKLLLRFSICGSVPEIFAIKFEICQKSRKILDDFLALINFCRRAFQKIYTVYHSCLPARRLRKFHEDTPSELLDKSSKSLDTPTSPEVIEPNTLNFRPNFKFSRLKFFGGILVPLAGMR